MINQVLYNNSGNQPFYVRDEAQLYFYWERLKGKSVQTSRGWVRIIYPGIKNHISGPDYLNAIIQMSNETLIQGHVEIHTKSSQWTEHKHHKDSEYQNVILHVFQTRNSSLSFGLIEYVLNPDQIIPAVDDPCINLSIQNNELLYILENLGEIRWSNKVEQLNTFTLEEVQFSLLKLIHFQGETASINKLFNSFLTYQKAADDWMEVLNPMYQITNDINWKMGGRRPASHPIKKLPLLMYFCWWITHDISCLPTNWKEMKLIIESLRSAGYQVPGKAFAIEILGNVILPYLELKVGYSYYAVWKALPCPDYTLIKKRLKKWKIILPIKYGHSQGILLLEKEYCKADNCYQCPVMNCTEPCLL